MTYDSRSLVSLCSFRGHGSRLLCLLSNGKYSPFIDSSAQSTTFVIRLPFRVLLDFISSFSCVVVVLLIIRLLNVLLLQLNGLFSCFRSLSFEAMFILVFFIRSSYLCKAFLLLIFSNDFTTIVLTKNCFFRIFAFNFEE